MFPDIQTLVSNFWKKNLGKLYDRPKHEQKYIKIFRIIDVNNFLKIFHGTKSETYQMSKNWKIIFCFSYLNGDFTNYFYE